MVAVRHGETEWNRRRLFMGTRDVPLARDALDGHRPTLHADVVVTSPLRRASATAAALFPGRCLVDARLVERHMGEWEGRSKAAVRAERPELFPGGHLDAHVTPPGGEPLPVLLERVRSFLADYAGSERRVVVVTHNGWIRAAQLLLGAAELGAFHAEPAPHLQVLPISPCLSPCRTPTSRRP